MRRKKIPKLEKPRDLYLEKILQDNCLYKSWGHCRAVWLLWWTPADSAEKTSVCDLIKAAEGACDEWLEGVYQHFRWCVLSLPSQRGFRKRQRTWTPGSLEGLRDSGSSHGEPPVTGDCLQRLHFPGSSQGNYTSLKEKKSKPPLFCFWRRVRRPQALQHHRGQLHPTAINLSHSFTSLTILTLNSCITWAPGNFCCLY